MKWDLDSLYSENEIIDAMERAKNALETFSFEKKPEDIVQSFQDIKLSMRDIESYILCRTSEDVTDKKAELLHTQFLAIDAKLETIDAKLSEHFALLSKDTLGPLLKEPYTHIIQERIEKKRSSDESLLNDLSIDGFHGWSQMYDALITSIQIEHEGKTLSFGQAENLLSMGTQSEREALFKKIENSFAEKAPLFARVLNHIAGFRLEMNTKRGYTHFLDEPLANNRMQKDRAN